MEPTTNLDPHPPNHHADHPGFAGPTGVLAALSMAFGRDDTADLAAGLVDLGPGDRVVDVGCGPGAAARRAARAGAAVVGVDPAAVMVRTARLLDAHRRATFVEGSAERLPMADGWATVAWTLASVHHWHDVDAGIVELARVLAPGGRLVAMERRIGAGGRGLASHGWQPEQAASFARRCREAGFVAVDTVERPTRRGPVLGVVGRTPA